MKTKATLLFASLIGIAALALSGCGEPKAAKPAATASDRRRSQAQPPRFAFASRVSMHGYSGTASAVLISSSSTLKAQN